MTAIVDLDNNTYDDMVSFRIYRDGVGSGYYGAATEGEEAIFGVPYAQKLVYGSSNFFTVPAGYRYMLGMYKDYLYALQLAPLPTGSVTVHMPDGVNLSDYIGMNLVLTSDDSFSPKSYTLEMTDASTYTFYNIDSEKRWSVTVVNEYKDEFGTINNIVVGDGNVDVTFDNLKKSNTVTLTVLNPDGIDVTDQTLIEWYNDDEWMNEGASILRQPAGRTLRYKISLSQSLAATCVEPATASHVVSDGVNNITCQLLPLGNIVLTGKVLDAGTGQPIAGAKVSATQYNAGYNNVIETTTEEGGSFSLNVAYVSTILKIVASGYLTRSINIDSLTVDGSGTITLQDIMLKPAAINVQFTFTPAHLAGEAAETQPGYSDCYNVDFKIYNNSRWREIEGFSVSLPQILIQEDVSEGDVLRLTATSRKNEFSPVTTTVMLTGEQTEATINIVEYGKIVASNAISSHIDVVGILYDNNGKRIKTETYVDKVVEFDNLPDGRYTLITMVKNDLWNTVYDLSTLSAIGLQQGKDYLLNTVAVSSGIITPVYTGRLSAIENSIYIGDGASFTVSPSNVLTGNYLTFRAQVQFKEEYASQVSDVKLIVLLPSSCPFYPNSVMVGNKVVTDYNDYNGNGLQVPLTNPADVVRFCATPSAEGSFSPNAFVQFKYNGKVIIQPIGCAEYAVHLLTFRVSSITGDPEITVSGTASKGKTVKVYDGNVLIAQTQCLENGTWRVRAHLDNPISPSVHHISAAIVVENGLELKTEVKDVIYREFAPQIDKIDMIYHGSSYVFDYVNGTALPRNYSYNLSIYDFTFVATLLGTTATVSNLKFKVLDTGWNVKTYDSHYDALNHRWFCSANYSFTSKLPTSVGLSYDYTWEGVTYHYETEFVDHTNGVTPNITPCIDPSGFVYEGVPSNRVEGVTATCYYKDPETGEAVLWDAEQYEQQNPLITDENGRYRWDVPVGQWQVKYEKDGYETTYSDWLPVPPPQLDVNIGMVQKTQPVVAKAHAYPQAVELEFDKYMYPETLTTDNITVSVNGKAVSGTIELLNAEVDDPLAITTIRRAPGTGLTFASRIRFNADQPFNADKVTLHVKKDVTSYAGVQMNTDYEVVLPLEQEMQAIVADSAEVVPFMGERLLNVAVQPAAAAAGKVLNVRSMAPMIATTNAQSYTLDSNGAAVITVHGDLPGASLLLFSIEGYNLTASTLVNVSMEAETTVATPTASIASDSEVEKGTEVYLYCTTPDATIYYTLDGSNPQDATDARMVYDGSPIIINSDVTIKAMATCEGMYDSEVTEFTYHVTSTGLKGDVNGDGAVNIADINKLIDYILRDLINSETLQRGDVNGDGTINISDINAVIQIILGPSASHNAAVNTTDLLHLNDLTLSPGETGTLHVTVDNAARYSALQCDIVLPDGLTLVDATAAGSNLVETGLAGDNTSRALTYSMNLLPFDGDTQPVLTLTVRADAALTDVSQVTLTDIVLADLVGVAWYASDCTARINNASGINDITAGAGKQITSVRYYNVAGQQVDQPSGMTIQVTTYSDGSSVATRTYRY